MPAPNKPCRTTFAPLPRMHTDTGEDRRVGVEIEFAGLTEHDVARLAQSHLGGRIATQDAHRITLADTALGTLKIELDTALKAWGGNRLVDAGLDAARGLIPVELVTEPLDLAGLNRLDAFRETLRAAGALGTHDGVLLGFGVHFNVAVAGMGAPVTARTILAFGLLEDWLRLRRPIDTTRRLMPFVAPWPSSFVETLAADAPDPAMRLVRDAYARHCDSRNFALDLLPLFKFADAAAFAREFPRQDNTKARPAFHYRLSDSRIDECEWSLELEWNRWRRVEELAETPGRLKGLAADYIQRARPLIGESGAWARHVDAQMG